MAALPLWPRTSQTWDSSHSSAPVFAPAAPNAAAQQSLALLESLGQHGHSSDGFCHHLRWLLHTLDS